MAGHIQGIYRSQRGSYNWRGFQELVELFTIEQPRIVGRPKARRAVSIP
jgi:hypothetical protein